jgi:hypothetical protein
VSDNFGNNASRVLDVSDKSWDDIVFKERVPPLSSDWTGVNQIASLKSQDAARVNLPSGWVQAGSILQTEDSSSTESSAISGQIVTSDNYLPNSFKLISKGNSNVALVNGWSINVQQTNSNDDNNVLFLDSTVSSAVGKVDFVFLEVWRELVDSNSAIYPYGNVGANKSLENDLLYNVTGAEHSQRVQIKYRVRTKISSSNSGIELTANPEGFGNEVKALGGNAEGEYTEKVFSNQSANGDAGLWRAGTGSDQDKAALNTVDGYVYAIPMLAVYRRADSVGFSEDRIDSTAFEKADNVISDRPDGKLLDVIYKDDIIDLRHKITPNGQSIKSIADKTFQKAISGTLDSKRGLASNGSGFVEMPGGSLLMKGEQLGNGSASIPSFGSFSGTGHKSRSYSNSGKEGKPNFIINVPHSGPWSAGETGTVEIITSEAAELKTVDGLYSITSNTDVTSGITGVINGGSYDYTIPSGSPLVGTSDQVNLQYSVDELSGSNGFLDVPESMLEIRNENSGAIIPTSSKDVPARGESTSVSDYIKYQGAEYTDTYSFGVDIVIHRDLDTSSTINLSFLDNKLYGHEIVGIKSIKRSNGSGSYGTSQSFALERTEGANTEYVVSSIGSIDDSSDSVEITVYAKTKFFNTSSQGRGVTDIYEVIEVEAVEESPNNWFIDTVDKPIIAIASTALGSGAETSGTSFAFLERFAAPGTDEKVEVTSPILSSTPALGSDDYVDGLVLPTKAKVVVNAAPSIQTGDTVKVPVIVHSYVESSDLFSFYYSTKGYQGYHVNNLNGSVIEEGSAVVTTAGSGSITDLSYGTEVSGDKAIFTQGSRTVSTDGDWGDYISPGDYISNIANPVFKYKVSSVDSSTSLTLDEIYRGDSSGISGDDYVSEKLGIPKDSIANVIDRMPSLNKEDYLGESETLADIGSVFTVLPMSRKQDPINSEAMDIRLGSEGLATRGSKGFLLTFGDNEAFNLKEKTPDITYVSVSSEGTYKKVYQGYVFNKNESGRIYLLIISSESNKDKPLTSLTSLNTNDCVDLFELVGRPLIKNG